MDNPAENNFWWTIDLEAEDKNGAEEALLTVADLSGSIGSELLRENGTLVLRAAYRSSQAVAHWLDEVTRLLAGYPGLRVRAHAKVENRAWHTQHLDAFPPLDVGEGLVIMAPWHEGREHKGRLPVYIYPSSAFGTGYHESTQIALALLERFVKKDDTVLDIGTGTGVLFIAALKLGARGASARDLDPTTISEAQRNMGLNGLAHSLCDLRVGDLAKSVDKQADVLTANILLKANLMLLPDVRRILKPGGVAIFSGMTAPEREDFLSSLAAYDLLPLSEVVKNEWWGCAARLDVSGEPLQN